MHLCFVQDFNEMVRNGLNKSTEQNMLITGPLKNGEGNVRRHQTVTKRKMGFSRIVLLLDVFSIWKHVSDVVLMLAIIKHTRSTRKIVKRQEFPTTGPVADRKYWSRPPRSIRHLRNGLFCNPTQGEKCSTRDTKCAHHDDYTIYWGNGGVYVTVP